MGFSFLLHLDDVPRKSENPLYRLYMHEFLRVFADVRADEDLMKYCYVQKHVVPDRELLAIPGIADVLQHGLLGEYEADLLSYIFSYEKAPYLCVVGPIGCGKSTVIHNVVTRILAPERELARGVFTIHIDFNLHNADLRTAGDSSQLIADCLHGIVTRALYSDARRWLSLTHEAYWDFVYETSDAFWNMVHGRYSAQQLAEGRLGAASEVRDMHERFLETKDAGASLMRFYAEKLNRKVVVFADNIDLLPMDAQTYILALADWLHQEAAARTVISLRDSTFGRIRARMQHRLLPILPVEPPPYGELLRLRTSYFLDAAARLPALAPVHVAQSVKLSEENLRRLLVTLVGIMLRDEAVDRLERCSNRDVRLAERMLIAYFRSGFFHDDLLRKVAGYVADEGVQPDIPGHLLIQSIVTGNRETFAPPGERLDTIVNVWFEGELPAPWAYFMRMQVLAFFSNHIHAEARPRDLARALKAVYAEVEPLKERLAFALRRIVRCFINCRLLETADCLWIEDGQRLDPTVELALSEAGRYYVNEMAYLVEYV